MTPLEKFSAEATALQAEKNLLFTEEIRATQTYEDMHTNKGALDAVQSEFLVMVENFNKDCLYPSPDELSSVAAVESKLSKLRETLEKIRDTIYTIKWE